MRILGLGLCLIGLLVSLTIEAQAEDPGKLVPGFSVGLAYTPDNDYSAIGWTVAGSLEHQVSKVCELRGRVGAVGLTGDIQDSHPSATIAFLTADVLAADLVTPTGGIGLYYVDLQAPLVENDQATFQFGVNAGLRVLIPYHHEPRGVSFDAMVHHVFGEGPTNFITIGAGVVF